MFFLFEINLNGMDDFRLPTPLMGLLRLAKLKGLPDFDIRHKSSTVEVTLYWKKATQADARKKKTSAKTKPKTSKPTTKSMPRATPQPAPKDVTQTSSTRTTPKPTSRPPAMTSDSKEYHRCSTITEADSISTPADASKAADPPENNRRVRCRSTLSLQQSACAVAIYTISWPSILQKKRKTMRIETGEINLIEFHSNDSEPPHIVQ